MFYTPKSKNIICCEMNLTWYLVTHTQRLYFAISGRIRNDFHSWSWLCVDWDISKGETSMFVSYTYLTHVNFLVTRTQSTHHKKGLAFDGVEISHDAILKVERTFWGCVHV